VRHRFAAAVLLAAGLILTGSGHAQTKIARVGILMVDLKPTSEQAKKWLEPFRLTLANQGWIEGTNVSFEYNRATVGPSRFEEAARELVQRKVDVILATSAPTTRAAYAATRTIPIIGFDFTNDPVAAGYAETYGRPGRNLTGIFLDAPEFAGKWLELLKAMIPELARVAVLWDPAPGPTHLRALQGAARRFGVELQVVEVQKPEGLNEAFAAFRARPQALVVLPSPMLFEQSIAVAELAKQHRLAGISMSPLFAEAGGLMSYGPDLAEVYERCGILVAKILRGTKPGDLPIERPARLPLSINLKTAKALGLTVPDSIQLRADNVIR